MTEHVSSSAQPAWHSRFLQLLPAIRFAFRFPTRTEKPRRCCCGSANTWGLRGPEIYKHNLAALAEQRKR